MTADLATSPLFQPFRLLDLELANRIAMAPMTRSFSPGQVPGEDVAEYYRKRAAGGVGLIITEGTTLADPASTSDHRVPQMHGEPSLDGWRRTVEAVHAEGARIMPQLWHVGALRKSVETEAPDVPTRSPSGRFAPTAERGETMSEETIQDTIADYARAAASAQEIGFDGVEIHGAHGYLIDQFFWAGTNQRDDQWGGDLVGRTRFAQEVVRAVRAATSPRFPILLRFSQWKQQDFEARLAQTPDELEQFLAPLVDAGVDCFHCSTRRYWEPEWPEIDGDEGLNLAGWTKKLTGKPTVTVGSIGLDTEFIASYGSDVACGPASLERLEQRLEREEFDLAAVGRALIANPEWPNLVRAGRLDELASYKRSLLAELV